MLALTGSAVQAVQEILSSSEETAGDGRFAAGCRAGRGADELPARRVALPAEDDEVIEEQGARVFLDPEVASLLDDKILDASLEPNQVAFTIADQAEEPERAHSATERSRRTHLPPPG
jgi:iron-sulfur cluster assembly protein